MKKANTSEILIYVVLIGWAFVVLFPVYWIIVTSFKPKIDVWLGPKYIPWVDFIPTSAWWVRIFTVEKKEVFDPFINSLIVASSSSLVAMLGGAMGAYALVRFKFRVGPLRNRDMLLWIISQRMMPPIVIILAIYIMFRVSNLLDTRLGLMLLYAAFNLPIGVWMMRSFILDIPSSLEEAAMIDGASRIRIFFQIVVPLVSSGLAATFLICFVFAWNEFLFSLILTFDRARTFPIFLASQHFDRGPMWWDISALSILVVTPVVIISLLLQSHFVKGIITEGR